MTYFKPLRRGLTRKQALLVSQIDKIQRQLEDLTVDAANLSAALEESFTAGDEKPMSPWRDYSPEDRQEANRIATLVSAKLEMAD